MYVITGATGHTGSVIATKLLDASKKVRVIGRSKEKLQPFVTRGAEAFAADLNDIATMTRAFGNSTAVYAMIPPDYSGGDLRAAQDRTGEALAAAIAKAGVTHVVSLSSLGADKPAGTGPIAGLHQFEKKLDSIATPNVLHLRPSYFYENFLMMIPAIKQMGALAEAFRPDAPVPMIATRDIGERAADELLKLRFTAHTTRELRGPRDYTLPEVAQILGAAVGKPDLKYTQAPYEAVEQALAQMGIPQKTAALFTEMTRAINEGRVKPLEPRSPENTTPTTLEQWAAEVFAPAFHGKAVSA